MRFVRRATCTLVEPVSVWLAPCCWTISCLTSFVRPISPPYRQSQQSAGSRRKAAAAVGGQGSNDLLQEELAEASLGDVETAAPERRQIGDAHELSRPYGPESECAQELDRVVERRAADDPLSRRRIGRDREESRREQKHRQLN